MQARGFLRSTWVALVVLCWMSGHQALAQQAEIFQSKRPDYAANVLAVGGFDAVAYHTQKNAVPGSGQFRVSWKGAEWHFSSKENLDLFTREPEKYAPQYGGYCAFAVAGGGTAPGDPKLWDVVNGKLYLNLSSSTQASWRQNPVGMIQRGDANWPRVIGR